ncbi:MAG: hypothetical protein IJV39_03920 [Ruminococcus sp.]|nr:hypothetical protein [Ruminococcus sp.]
MKKNKHSVGFLSRLFSNKIFLVILSVVVSLNIWMNINMSDYGETSYVVNDIPISITLPDEAQDLGLEIFNSDDLVGSVTVTGNRSIIGRLDKDDIQIVPEQTDSLTSAGSYTLSLVAKKTGGISNYTINSVSPSAIYIKLDRTREITKKITNNINYTIPDYYYGNVFLSDDEVTISGPESEIKQIDSVVVSGTVKNKLTETVKKEYKVKLLDSFGEVINTSDAVTITPSKVTATIKVLQMKNVGVNIVTQGAPTGIELSNYYSISPSKVSVAGESADIANVKLINTDAVDFSTLQNKKYKLTQNLEFPDNCIDINSINTVEVNMDLSAMKKKTLTISDFDIEGLDEAYDGEVTTSSLEVTVYGIESQLKKLSNSNISAVVDLTNSEVSEGSKEMALTLTIKDVNGCWIYGSYNAVVKTSKK